MAQLVGLKRPCREGLLPETRHTNNLLNTDIHMEDPFGFQTPYYHAMFNQAHWKMAFLLQKILYNLKQSTQV